MAEASKTRAPSMKNGVTARFIIPDFLSVTTLSNTAFSKWLLDSNFFRAQKNRLAKRLAKR